MIQFDPCRIQIGCIPPRVSECCKPHARSTTGRILTAEKMDAHNTFDRPDAVKPAPFDGAEIHEGDVILSVPSKSVVVLEID